MPLATRSMLLAGEKSSSKEVSLTGKENVRPSTSRGKKVSTANHREELRRRVSLSSNVEKKKEKSNAKTSQLSESFVKKTPFHVHCDDKNVAESESKDCCEDKRVSEEIAVSLARREEESVQEVKQVDGRLTAQKSVTNTETKHGKLMPSKIPRQCRSSSACTGNQKPQRPYRRSASMDVKVAGPQDCRCKAAAAKFGWSGAHTKDKQTEVKLFGEGARGPTKKIDVATVKSNRVAPINTTIKINKPKILNKPEFKPINGSSKSKGSPEGSRDLSRVSRKEASSIFQFKRNLTVSKSTEVERIAPRAIDRIKARLLNKGNQTKVSAKEPMKESSTETPVDGAAPPSIAFKRVVREATKSTTEPHKLEEKDSTKDIFSFQLLRRDQYYDDLPIVEYEREKLSPQLSDEFLSKHLNAEQRRLVVIFMLRLGLNYRFPSYIVYQAVKLFDAVMDRMQVEVVYIQLVALASLWIVLKNKHYFHKIPLASSMVALAGDLYRDRQNLLIYYEKKILVTLNFNITFSDVFSLFTYHFISCRCYIELSEDAVAFIYYTGGYLIDLTLLDEQFCRVPASLLALAVAELTLGLTIDAIEPQAKPKWLFWRGILFTTSPQVASKYADEDIDRTRIAMLQRIMSSVSLQGNFAVVYKKYSRSKYGRISSTLLERAAILSSAEIFMS